jgi:hypothetical protein
MSSLARTAAQPVERYRWAHHPGVIGRQSDLLPGRGNECAENAKTTVAVGFVRQDGTKRPTPADQDEEQSMIMPPELIEELRTTLETLPKPPPRPVNITKQEIVRQLVGEIQAVQRRGYTLEQVAEAFRGKGFLLTTPTLKNYLARAKAPQRGKAGKKAKAGGGAKASAPAAPALGVSTVDTGGGAKKAATAAQPPATRVEARTSSEGCGREGASRETPDGIKFRSGKDAFMTEDKKEY